MFKNLGPQIGYSTVFLLEYLGPLVIFPLFYLFRTQIYGSLMGIKMSNSKSNSIASEVQWLAMLYWCSHYAKRMVETLTIHSFSHATMPIGNLFTNCSYYYGFAAYVAYFVMHPLYTAPPIRRVYIGLGLAMMAQLGNRE